MGAATWTSKLLGGCCGSWLPYACHNERSDLWLNTWEQVVGTDHGVAVVHAPVAVLPVPFPRESFETAKSVATIYNTLVDRVSQDDEYVESTLRLAAQYDDFTVS